MTTLPDLRPTPKSSQKKLLIGLALLVLIMMSLITAIIVLLTGSSKPSATSPLKTSQEKTAQP